MLSKSSGLSISYLNEIERGKKYPKTDKIVALARALDSSYDALVSLQLPPKLQRLGNLLTSNIISDLPLYLFGLDFGKMVEWMSNEPVKFSAFIGTITEIARTYDLQKEYFYFAALRSYQELHDNYFEELEEGVQFFIKKYKVDTLHLSYEFFENLLRQKFACHISYFSLETHPELTAIRYVFLPEKNRLLLHPRLNESQKAFIIGREITFNVLKAKERPTTSVMVQVPSFEHLINHFKASYCTAALLIPRERLLPDIEHWLAHRIWKADDFFELLAKYPVSAELFLFRLTNILPKFFNIKDLFLLRFQQNRDGGNEGYDLTKELHLSQDAPQSHSNETLLHYCRRWSALQSLQLLNTQQQQGSAAPAILVQRSVFLDSGNEYWCLSVARAMDPTPLLNSSVTIGLRIDEELAKKAAFVQDPHIQRVVVNQNCENCPLHDCQERVAPPTLYENNQQQLRLQAALLRLKDEQL